MQNACLSGLFAAVLLVVPRILVGFQDSPAIPPDILPDVLGKTSPFGLPELEDIGDDAEAALGRRLFFDPILSADHTVACASCHDPRFGFADPRPLSRGVFGRTTLRHAPTLVNRAYGRSFMWDGRIPTLRQQVLQPIENEREMNLPIADAIARLHDHEEYAQVFEHVFARPADREALAIALAAFVGRIRKADSPVDRFRAGQFSTLSDSERAGLWLFESRGQCWRCHSGPNFTDEALHNTGVGAANRGPGASGDGQTAGDPERDAFKTPTLRGVAISAPYFHDGSAKTLRDVVDHYRRGGVPGAKLDPLIAPIEMTDNDVDNLVALLRALSREGS